MAPVDAPRQSSKRPFWLGVIVATCLLVPLGAVLAIAVGRGEEPSRPSAAPDAEFEAEAERLRRVSQTRDKGQVEDLTNVMRRYADDLDPVVDGLDKTLPPGDEDKLGPLAEASQVAEWQQIVGRAVAFFEESVSGDTGTNVARGTLASAVRGIARTVET